MVLSSHRVLLAAGIALFISIPGLASTQPIDADTSCGINVTIYNQNLGLVRDIRNVDLKSGINQVDFQNVAAQIDPTSVSFVSRTAPNAVTIKEQNYQYDLMDPATILSKSIGKNIKLKQVINGQVHETTGILLNAPHPPSIYPDNHTPSENQSLVVQTISGFLLSPAGEVELSELPAGLVSRPSLLWKIECTKPGQHECEIAYQTGGLNWKCDYVAISNADDSQADLTSWVTLDNQSGASYKNAQLKLIAGDIHRVSKQPRPVMGNLAYMSAAAPQFHEESFAEYHLYTLKDRTDVNNKETKQLTLFSANNVPTKKLYIFETESPYFGYTIPQPSNVQKVKVEMEIHNTQDNKLGMPMPKGKVRVYKKDSDGALQFIGEDEIDHTPKGERIRLNLGEAFDLTGERIQTNLQSPAKGLQHASYEISLRNHKDNDVTVTDVEHACGNWKILGSNQPYIKKDSKTFEFAVKVPANGQTKIIYDIETRS